MKNIKTNLSNRINFFVQLSLGILISENNLINGIIEKTRGLGNHGDKDLKKCLINSPYCWTYPIDANLECIVIATEGLWDVLRYDIVVDIVTQVNFESKSMNQIQKEIPADVLRSRLKIILVFTVAQFTSAESTRHGTSFDSE